MTQVKQLKSYLNYCKTKPKPRSNSYQSAVEDCIEVLNGNFSKIKQRDLDYDAEFQRLLKKKKKTKKK